MELSVLKIAGTEDTPEIHFNSSENEYVISGRSLPEDVSSFYKPVFDWLNEFEKNSVSNPSFKFKLEYFNTASSKIILDILMRLEDINGTKSSNIGIDWYYMESDDDMLEAGEEYKDLVDIPFNVIAY
jgi:hypothetical protein